MSLRINTQIDSRALPSGRRSRLRYVRNGLTQIDSRALPSGRRSRLRYVRNGLTQIDSRADESSQKKEKGRKNQLQKASANTSDIFSTG